MDNSHMTKELIVVALDHTPAGTAALRWAVDWAIERDARVLTVRVHDVAARADLALERDLPGERARAVMRANEQVIGGLGSRANAVSVTVSLVEGALVSRLGRAAERASLLVLGQPQSADHQDLPDAVARGCSCPVVVVDEAGVARRVSESTATVPAGRARSGSR
jgi:nucleotide-binding universal stress UspA family protein